MKVGELRKMLEGVPDDYDVVVRAWNDEADYCGTVDSVAVNHDHGDDSPYLALDCGPDEDDSDG